MPHSFQQQGLDFSMLCDYSSESYIHLDSQKIAYDYIMSWPNWLDHVLVLHGPEFSGKTHLAHLWQKKTGAVFADMHYSNSDPVIIDDFLAEDLGDDFFHFYNRIRELKSPCLILTRKNPLDWSSKFSDIESRVRSFISVQISPPSHQDMRLLLNRLMSLWQVQAPERNIHRFLLNSPRSYGSLKDFFKNPRHTLYVVR